MSVERKDALIEAVHLATRKLAGAGNFDDVLRDVLEISVEAVGASGGTIYLHDRAARRLRFRHVLPESVAERLPFRDIADDEGMAGAVFQSGQPRISEFQEAQTDASRKVEQSTGVVVRSMITVPLAIENMDPIGIVQLVNKKNGNFDDTDAAVLDTIGAVSTLAFLNSQLIEEQSRASSLLGMGKVSHDIGNLAASLFATLTFSDHSLTQLRTLIGPNVTDPALKANIIELELMSKELRNSVERIVGYARLISDLSAGRELRPKMVVQPIGPTIRTSAAYLQTEGRNNFVRLNFEVEDGAPPLSHDPLYVFRIVQNLVGNAIKAVRETLPHDFRPDPDSEEIHGDVFIRYRFTGNEHILEVADTGLGMPRHVAERILAGTARSMWDKGGGSGWGTKIVLELAATHNAAVEIDSEIGKGSTFRVRFPHR
ncbi:MAG: ATP-binding protein [Fimbriimonadaceae bacterium]